MAQLPQNPPESAQEDSTMDTPVIDGLCKGLHRWYTFCGVGDNYDQLFTKFGDENGFDDETVVEDLETDISEVDESQVVGFLGLDDNPIDFPFGDFKPKNKTEKQEFLFKLLVQLMKNPNFIFVNKDKIPKFNKQMFDDLTKDDIEVTRQMYESQLPVFYHQGMAVDINMLYILTVGRKNGFDYLSHLVDDFARARVLHYTKCLNSDKDYKPLTSQEHCSWEQKGHPLFKKLKNINVDMVKLKSLLGNDGKWNPASQKNNKFVNEVGPNPNKVHEPPGYHLNSKMAIQSSLGRIMPKLNFSPLTKFNNSIKSTLEYIEQASAFVENLIKNTQVCPFQFDLVLAMGKPSKSDEKYDDDDPDEDDDDGDDDEEQYFDYVGDIKGKLEANKLAFVTMNKNPASDGRVFDDLYKQYKEGNKLGDEKEEDEYLRKKRIIGLVDRRQHANGVNDDAKTDAMFMYEPPECSDPTGNTTQSARTIPNDALPEWYLGATRMVLLPDMNFGTGPTYGAKNKDHKVDKPKKKDKESAEKFTSIDGGFGAAGSVLTLSFHAKEERVVKMYLFCNRQCIRVMPEDIKIVLRALFNMDYGDNADWIDGEEADNLIGVMKGRIVDEHFAAFQQSFC